MTNEIIIKEENNIKDMIYEIRGKQVMLDSDLAKLYQCKNGTKEINQAVKRNINKFPERFSWVLLDEETLNLRSQIVTTKNRNSINKKRYNSRVFTEQGIAMLATVLKTEIADEVSIKIMDAFVLMRRYITSNYNYDQRISNLEIKYIEHDNKIDKVLKCLEKPETNNHIFFEGQIYDAYSKIIDILSVATKELIIIDNYSDKTLLDIISKINKKTLLITSKDSYIEEIDINKYNEQYTNLQVIINNTFHDRYFIIDKNIFYHCGSSINKAGTKTFSINKIEDGMVKKLLIDEIKEIKEKEMEN